MNDNIIPFPIEDLGDGLFRQGGDICCNYPLISFKREETKTKGTATFDYGKYYIIVTYEIDGNTNKNPSWKRVYKAEAGENNG